MQRDEFLAMQPRQMDALMRYRNREREDKELMFAQIAAAVVNFGFRAPKESVKPADFMPSEIRKRFAGCGATPAPMTEERRQTMAERLKQSLGAMFEAFEGKR